MKTLAFAIQMEVDAEAYYARQAELNSGNELETVFLLLAAAEKKHAILLEDLAADKDIDPDVLVMEKEDNLFTRLDDFSPDTVMIPDQSTVYEKAKDMEQKSIDLYREALEKAVDITERQVLTFLVQEEERHYALFDELIIRLSRPKEWVENAEFGNREEY